MEISTDIIISIITGIMSIIISITIYYLFRYQLRRDNILKIQDKYDRMNHRLKSEIIHLREDSERNKFLLTPQIEKYLKDYIPKIKLGTIKEIPEISHLLDKRLKKVETEIDKIKREEEIYEKRKQTSEEKKIELENEKLEHDMRIEMFKYYPNRTWPKYVSTIGVGLTTGSLSIGSFLYSQGQNYIVIFPIVLFGAGIFSFGLYFWARDDKQKVYYFRKSFMRYIH